jgi:3',5'-cyclic AMP phosphodiesterase CpdA
MQIAHLSDLHILDLRGVSPLRFLNKRVTGYANLRLRRNHQHRPSHVRALCKHIRERGVDHVVVTGDLTNLALESEFHAVASMLHEQLGMPASRVSIVPGNHDCYTGGAFRAGRFESFFGEHLTSDTWATGALSRTSGPSSAFPYVRVLGEVALLGLSSAVVRPPFMAAGLVDADQRARLQALLRRPELSGKTRVFLMHHPLHDPPSRLKALRDGLYEAEPLMDIMGQGIVLHGHLHRRVTRSFRGGSLVSYGTTSASLEHEDHDRMAGFNLYTFCRDGKLERAVAHVLAGPHTDQLVEREIPS